MVNIKVKLGGKPVKTYKTLALILVLVILTGIATWFHLSSREEVAEGTTQLTIDKHKQTVKLDALNYEPVSGVRVNGKGETIPVEGKGISVKALLLSMPVFPQNTKPRCPHWKISWTGTSRCWNSIRNGHWWSDTLMKASPVHLLKNARSSCG